MSLVFKLHQTYSSEETFRQAQGPWVSTLPAVPGQCGCSQLASTRSLDWYLLLLLWGVGQRANQPLGFASARLSDAQWYWATPDYSLFPAHTPPFAPGLKASLSHATPLPKKLPLPPRPRSPCILCRPCAKAVLLGAGLGFAETSLGGPSLPTLLWGLYLPYSQVPAGPSSVTCHIKYMRND